ncbi:hypothetical protein [Tepidibacillus marianensis]|uniref:hypothetical protein n=1 Tax=Tepidibacillus marianensis TaxID=3131995 RepID=UPI0030CD1F96
MPSLYDLTGNEYGRLKVIQLDAKRSKKTKRVFWVCQCSCGNITSVRSDMLGKKTSSCGCLKEEQNEKNLGRFTTGESHSRLATIWYHMKSRCDNPKDTNYRNYGNRGITVCEEWKNDFLVFKEWAVNNGYQDGLSIDRIDVNGNYEPNNCRWLKQEDQLNNKRSTLWVEHKGDIKSLMQAYKEEKPNITYQTAKTRYHQGITDINELFKDRKK